MAPEPFASLIVVLVALTAASGCLGGDRSESSRPLAVLESVPLVNHIQFGVFEMDVFVQRDGSVEQVYRPTGADAATPQLRQAPLFRTASTTPHDPTFTQAGPFAAGAPLGITLGSWLDGRGAIAYRCEAGTASVAATFAKLLPNGVYTLWYARLSMTAGAITGAAEHALGALDGSQNRFVADAQGNGALSLASFPCVEPTAIDASGNGVATVFAAAYHSDGAVYGASPGDFGRVTHVQLFAIAKALQQA